MILTRSGKWGPESLLVLLLAVGMVTFILYSAGGFIVLLLLIFVMHFLVVGGQKTTLPDNIIKTYSNLIPTIQPIYLFIFWPEANFVRKHHYNLFNENETPIK